MHKMIFEISKNKLTNKVNEQILNNYKEWFLSNKNVWIKSKDLEMYLCCNSTRIYINKLRCDGFPIISDVKKGYKFTTNNDEILESYEKLRLRALKALTSAKLMKKITYIYHE